ncbi:MAG: choice-of-anchor B family protein, partial [Planctomycetota bacterium]
VSPSGREYALVGVTTQSVVVEITDPANPVVVARMDGPGSLWRDIKVYQDHFYAVSEGGSGIQVFDLSQVDSGVVTLVNTITGQGTDETHNVAIDEDSGFLYRCGGDRNGLRIYSLANPSQPQYVGGWFPRYVHDAQIVTYTSGPYAGKQIAFCCAGLNNGAGDTGLSILDVTNKSNIRVMSQLGYPGREYSHQGWLSEDRTRFYLGDELDERGGALQTTRVFDVTDLDNAVFTGEFTTPIQCISHNMYERDGLLYQANYTSGVRVFDVAADPDQPEEIAFFDTAPDRTDATFNGCWSVYPFFPSGTIIASDLERGLFVLRLDPLDVSAAAPAPTLLSETGSSFSVDVTEFAPGAFDPASPTLEVRALGLEYTIPMDATGGAGGYTADFPGLPCGVEVQWWVSARTTGGVESTFPPNAPVEPFRSLAGASLVVARDDDMEIDAGWARDVAGDTAVRGLWERGAPAETDANPGSDSSTDGQLCWFTGQSPVPNNTFADVDAGQTTLLTPLIDMASMTEPVVSYDRWFHTAVNDNRDDVFDVEISNDGGATWTLLESVGPTGPEAEGGWIRATFRVRDHVSPTAQVQLRFIASDTGEPTIVEAGIDEFTVVDVACGTPVGVAYCAANANSTGLSGEVVAAGSESLAANELTLVARRLPPGQFGFFVGSRGQAFVPNLSGGQGNLCVGPSIGRFLDQIGTSSAAGTLFLDLDLTSITTATGPVAGQIGDTWNFQAWHRDVNPSPTSNLTSGIEITLQ